MQALKHFYSYLRHTTLCESIRVKSFPSYSRRVIAGLMLVAFSLHSFGNVAVIIDYYTNTAAYAKNCVNKAMPQMHCNGKCQMAKKLKEQEKKESRSLERKDISPELSFAQPIFVLLLYEKSVRNSYAVQSFYILPGISHSIFHPPGLVIA